MNHIRKIVDLFKNKKENKSKMTSLWHCDAYTKLTCANQVVMQTLEYTWTLHWALTVRYRCRIKHWLSSSFLKWRISYIARRKLCTAKGLKKIKRIHFTIRDMETCQTLWRNESFWKLPTLWFERRTCCTVSSGGYDYRLIHGK